MKWLGHVACMGEMRYPYKVLVGKLGRKRPLGRSRRRREDIKMYLKETGCKGVIGLSWLRTISCGGFL
jgi:hypothetical protein